MATYILWMATYVAAQLIVCPFVCLPVCPSSDGCSSVYLYALLLSTSSVYPQVRPSVQSVNWETPLLLIEFFHWHSVVCCFHRCYCCCWWDATIVAHSALFATATNYLIRVQQFSIIIVFCLVLCYPLVFTALIVLLCFVCCYVQQPVVSGNYFTTAAFKWYLLKNWEKN